jgi:hypothetical protein
MRISIPYPASLTQLNPNPDPQHGATRNSSSKDRELIRVIQGATGRTQSKN